MITPLRMVFLVTAMQTPLPVAGLIEGIAQGIGGVVRIAARRLSNKDKAQKGQVLLGYGISNAVKPLLAVVTSWPGALLITLLDTVGQGIRRDPLNKLIEGSTPRRGWHGSWGFMSTAVCLEQPLARWSAPSSFSWYSATCKRYSPGLPCRAYLPCSRFYL